MMSFGILPEHPVLVFPAYQAFSNLFILFLSAHVKTVVNDHEPVVNRFTLFASSGRGRPPGPSYTTVPPSTLRPTRPPVMMRMTNVQLFLSWGSWEYCTGGELLSISPIMGQIKHILRWTLGATWATIPTINKDHFSKLQTSLKSVRSFNTFFKGSNCTKIVFSKPSRHYNIRGVKSLWFWKSLKNVFFYNNSYLPWLSEACGGSSYQNKSADKSDKYRHFFHRFFHRNLPYQVQMTHAKFQDYRSSGPNIQTHTKIILGSNIFREILIDAHGTSF